MREEYNEWAKQQAESTAVMFLITSLQNKTEIITECNYLLPDFLSPLAQKPSS